MSRREFPRSVKIAVIKRAGATGMILCEKCGAFAKRWQIDHIRPDGLLGEPTLDNAQLLGECCYAPKNAADTRSIAKAKRREARHFGAKQSSGLMRSRGFPLAAAKDRTVTKRTNGINEIARRFAATED